MEKRVVLLVVLCVAVFVGWSLLMQAIYPPAPPKPPAPPVQNPGPSAPGPKPDATPPPADPQARQGDEPGRLTRLSNDRISLELTNLGAGIRSATLKVTGQADMKLLLPFNEHVPHLAVSAEGSGDDLARSAWSVKEEEPDRSITYLYRLRNGLDVEKKLTLERGKQEVELLLTIRNSKPDRPVDLRLRLTTLTALEHDSRYRYDYYGQGFVTTVSAGAHSTTPVSYDAPQPRPRYDRDPNPPRYYTFEVPPGEQETKQVEWFGLRNRYAAAVFLGREDRSWIRRVEFRPTTQADPGGGSPLKGLSVEADLREVRVGDQPHLAKFSLVLAPIRREELAAIPGGSDYLLSYGCWGLFNPIGRLILWVLGVAHDIAGNYGWAIILTTLVVRLAMFPLTRKSQVSMARMTELQPKLNLLREKYADDASKQQQETMKLFREHGVNPLSGCFPILLQLPIFIGLYSVLDISLEFRQAPFIAWISDLSQPDRLIPFKHPINLWITSLEEFNLVPIVMTITWFLQSYFAPRAQDPRMAAQQRMMLFMPVVFGLLCYSLASGLSLYLFVNSLLAMFEQKIIKGYLLPAKAPTGPPGKA